jgi:glycosyltransferase involved in cell wall biosynthesis
MAAGLPVVATDVGGVRELVAEGKTGFVVPSRDPDALAAALRTLLADGELRRRFGRSARARVESDFDVKRFRHEHVAVYETELARRGLLPAPAAALTVGRARL